MGVYAAGHAIVIFSAQTAQVGLGETRAAAGSVAGGSRDGGSGMLRASQRGWSLALKLSGRAYRQAEMGWDLSEVKSLP